MTKKKRGRPNKWEGEMTRLAASIPSIIMDKLREIAERKGLSMTEVIVKYIEQDQRHKNDKET